MYFDYLTEVLLPKYYERTNNNNPLVVGMLKGRSTTKNFDKQLSENFKKQLEQLEKEYSNE
jgi:hypothetical protein